MIRWHLIRWRDDAPTVVCAWMCSTGIDALSRAAVDCIAWDADQRISITNGERSWCGKVGQIYTLGTDGQWLGATSAEAEAISHR